MLLRCGRVFEEMPRSFVTMWIFAEFFRGDGGGRDFLSE